MDKKESFITGSEVVEERLLRKDNRLSGPLFFNSDHGFLESVLRGMRSGFLTITDYRQLCQCQNMDDVKLALGDTDYAEMLSTVNSSNITKDIILKACNKHFIEQFQFIRTQSVGSLSTFIDFITYEYLIDNISFIISGLIKRSSSSSNSNPVHDHNNPNTLNNDFNQFLSSLDPLGYDPHLKSILAVFEQSQLTSNSASNLDDSLLDLYQTVLIDMPVGKYFESYFKSQLLSISNEQGIETKNELNKIYHEGEFEVITNVIKKLWLEDFYQYTQTLSGNNTKHIMQQFLNFEADYRVIEMTMNSFGTQLNDSNERDAERKGLYCNFGTLYPLTFLKNWQDINDVHRLSENLSTFYPFNKLFIQALNQGKEEYDQVAIMSDLLKEYEVELMRTGFDGLSHFGCFYAWVKLKQTELRNIRYILSCIEQHQTDPKILNKWIPTFLPAEKVKK